MLGFRVRPSRISGLGSLGSLFAAPTKPTTQLFTRASPELTETKPGSLQREVGRHSWLNLGAKQHQLPVRIERNYEQKAVSKGSEKQSFASQAFQTTDKVDAKAQVIFDTCWRRLEAKWQSHLQTPKEVVWLNGAPGSGKGVNTPFILETRGLSRAVTMSSLFQDRPEIREIMDRGELVPDTMVIDALLETIFDPHADSAGLVIDGFPRTALQVELLKLLYDKLMALHVQHADSPDEWRFPRPSFKIVVLYVEPDESIKRQLLRARQASLHNRRVLDAGTGSLQDVRSTDADIVKCRLRYDVFKAHYGTLLRLKQYFPFSLIDAMGTIEECRQQISREMRYQSSMDLDETTYASIRHLPLARELVRTSRQQLVSHLDTYCRKHKPIFEKVIGVINTEALPLLKRCSLAGHAELKTHNSLFSEHPLAADMLMDILTDRGFATAYFVDEQVVPESIDMKTGKIKNRYEFLHHFRITFKGLHVRSDVTSNMSPAIALAKHPKMAEPVPHAETHALPGNMEDVRRALDIVPTHGQVVRRMTFKVSDIRALDEELPIISTLKNEEDAGIVIAGLSSIPIGADHQKPRPDFLKEWAMFEASRAPIILNSMSPTVVKDAATSPESPEATPVRAAA